MKAVVYTRKLWLDVVDLPVPGVEPHEVRVKVAYAGICGSDLHRSERATPQPGFVMGHEFCGTVDALGSDVSDWKVGDRAVILPMVACGKCWGCKTGRPELCEDGLLSGPGMGRAGGYAEYVSVPARMLRRLPDHVSMEHAALVEPLSVALHGVQISGAKPGDPALVLGAGPIGTFAAIGLRARGFQDIIVLEMNDSRRETVASLGFNTASPNDAHAVVKKTFGDRGPVVAYDCTGYPTGAPLAMELLKPNGRLILIGVPAEPVTMSLRRLAVDEIRFEGSIGYDDRDYDEAIDHVANGRVPCEQVTTIARLDEAQHWFDVLLSRKSNEIKVILKP